MKNTVQLSSQSIYDAHVKKEIKQIRRQRGKDAAHQMILFTLFLGGVFAITTGFTNGYFDNVDVIGTCHWINDSVMAMAASVSESLKSMKAG